MAVGAARKQVVKLRRAHNPAELVRGIAFLRAVRRNLRGLSPSLIHNLKPVPQLRLAKGGVPCDLITNDLLLSVVMNGRGFMSPHVDLNVQWSVQKTIHSHKGQQMTTSEKDLIEKIKSEVQKMAKSEGNAVLHAIKLGRLYVALKATVKKGRWAKSLKRLGVDPRVANRFITIGESWWASQASASGSLPLSLLPADVHKLEWISRLTAEQLPNFLKIVDCKNSSRGTVIKAVQRLLGDKPPASEDQPVSVKTLKKKWDSYVKRMVEAIGDLSDTEVTEEVRVQLLDELHAKFSEVEDALAETPAPSETDATPPVTFEMTDGDEPGEDADESPETADQQDAEEEPQEAAVAPVRTNPPVQRTVGGVPQRRPR